MCSVFCYKIDMEAFSIRYSWTIIWSKSNAAWPPGQQCSEWGFQGDAYWTSVHPRDSVITTNNVKGTTDVNKEGGAPSCTNKSTFYGWRDHGTEWHVRGPTLPLQSRNFWFNCHRRWQFFLSQVTILLQSPAVLSVAGDCKRSEDGCFSEKPVLISCLFKWKKPQISDYNQASAACHCHLAANSRNSRNSRCMTEGFIDNSPKFEFEEVYRYVCVCICVCVYIHTHTRMSQPACQTQDIAP